MANTAMAGRLRFGAFLPPIHPLGESPTGRS